MGKKVSWCLAVFLLLLLLTACGKDPADGTQGETVTPSAAPDDTADGDTEPEEDGTSVGAETEEGKERASLERVLNTIANMNLTVYANADSMEEPMERGYALLEREDATEEEFAAAREAIQAAYAALHDGSGLTAVGDLLPMVELPDPFLFLDGTAVETVDDWQDRAAEISHMYEYYMYGVWRDGSDEEVRYEYENGTMTIFVKRISTGVEVSFPVTVGLPDASKATMPEGGWPVIVGMHGGIQEDTANARGYATVILNTYLIASDDTRHDGVFYKLYPYGEAWTEQTGVLMAWAWGASKVLDALEAGAGEELSIDGAHSIVTGVSRWGKATAVCGAFEKRFQMAAPSCSGAGGLALYRYDAEGHTYDFSSVDGPASYTYTQTEPITSLQSAAESGWFNQAFRKFRMPALIPLDQHLLGSLVADEDRYLFIIGSCVSEDWVNAPSMWMSYLGMRVVYRFLGLEEHLAICIHKEGHAVIKEDMEYMIDYFNYHVYGIEPTLTLSDLTTSVFALEQNHDTYADTLSESWIYQ